ncbi:MAG TPA: glycerol-3-phosphate 1-O-acyltransferase PlsY [Candidatus Eisenbacteria bacterium]|nr:glycerol-3-phosphate 1-O-acyltransferase PlsY [Candidatus Eisenbacteria bacterium]
MWIAFVLAVSFLLGSLPWSLWVGQTKGIDLRKTGSGNLGATNVYRVLGWKLGLLVLVLDIAKGLVAVQFSRGLDPISGWLPAAAGFMAVLGHMASPFAGFKGGKGVATAFGVFLGMAPIASLLSFVVWMSTLAIAGWVSVASCMAALTLPYFVFVTRDDLHSRFPWAFALAIMIAILVVLRHAKNFERLSRGAEQRIWEKRVETPEQGAIPEEHGAMQP